MKSYLDRHTLRGIIYHENKLYCNFLTFSVRVIKLSDKIFFEKGAKSRRKGEKCHSVGGCEAPVTYSDIIRISDKWRERSRR